MAINTNITPNDSSERKRIEEALRRSEAHYRTLFEMMDEGFCILEMLYDAAGKPVDYRFLETNPAFERFTGLEQAKGKTARHLVPNLETHWVEIYGQVAITGEPRRFEEGSAAMGRWFDVYAFRIGEPENRQVALLFTNITERKQAEAALRTSEERLRLATEAGGVGIFDHDLIANQTEISDLYAHITGFPPAAVVTRENWLARVHPEDRSLVEDIWKQSQATGASYYYECRIIRPDGALVWIEVNALVTHDETGRAVRVTGALRDITERKQTALHQQFLLDLNAALRTLNDPATIQQIVIARLGQYLGASRCCLNAIDLAADKATVLAVWSQPELPPPADVIPLSAHATPDYIAGAQAGRTLVLHDAITDERTMTPEQLLRQRRFPATMRVPCLRDGQWVASLHILQTTPRQWRTDEVQLVESVVHHFWPLVEKARVEQALRRQEEFVRQIADNVPGLIGYLGADERYRFVNAAFERWFQRPRAQIIGSTVRELIGEEERARLGAFRQQALAGETISYETVFAYPDGITRTVWGRYQPDIAADGAVQGFYLFLMDISESKQAEEALRRSEERYRALVQSSSHILWSADARDGHSREAALWIEAFTGQSRPVDGPTTWWVAAIHPAERAAFVAAQRHSFAQRQPLEYEFRLRHHRGDYRYVLLRSVPLFNADGTLREWFGTLADITERRQVQEQLRASEERLRLALAAARMATFEYNATTQTVQRSPNALLVQGLGEHGVAGEYFTYVHPDDRSQLQQFIDGLTPAQDSYEFEYRFIRPDTAATIWLLDRAQAFFDQQGQMQRLIGVVLDISEHKQVEADTLFLAELSELIRPAEAADALLWAVSQAVGNYLQVGRCHFIEVDQDRARGIIHRDYCRGLPSVAGEYPLAAYSPTTWGELAAGRMLVNHDAQHDPRTAALYATVYQPAQERAYMAAPLLRNGQWQGIFSVTTPEARHWQPREIRLLEIIAERMWLAVEKLRLDAVLHANNAILNGVLESSTDAIFVRDLAGRYLLVNTAGADQVRMSKEAIIGKRYAELFTPAEVAAIESDDRVVLVQGQTVSLEHVTNHDATTRYWHTLKMPLRNVAGEIVGLISSARDFTDRKQMENALRTSEARFRQLADAMPQIVWACQADGTLTYINEQWQSYSGMSFAESLERGMWPALHPADQGMNRDQWRRALESGEPYEAEVRLQRADGEYRWHLERAIPIRNDLGVIEQWFGASVDIHDYKRIQEALLRANERFVLAEHASNGWVYDFDIQQWTAERSPGFYRILGYTPDEATADVKWWHSLFHPDDRNLLTAPAVNARGDQEFSEVEYRIRHRDGHYVHVLDRSRQICDAAGKRVRMVGITVDISERKRAELHQHFLSELGLQLRLLSDTEAMTAHLVHSLGHHLQVAGCRVNEINLPDTQFSIQKDWTATGKLASGVYPLDELAPPPLLAELQGGRTVVVTNTMLDPRTAAVADHYRTTQTTAFIGVPIFRQGQWSATLSVRAQGERFWRQDEIALVETVASHFQPLLEKARAEQALRYSEERLRLALAGGGMGIWEWQLAPEITTWSEQEYALFGLAPTTTITSALFAGLLHPEDRPGLKQMLDNAATQGNDYIYEFRIIRPDGTVRWLAERAIVIRDNAGRPARILGINYDISERKQNERDLQELNATLEKRVAERTAALESSNQELARSNRELEQFTYAAAHDLKSPLRGIHHLAQWISEDAAAVLSPQSQKHLIQLHGRVQRLEQLLDDMLAYSRIGRVHYGVELVDTNILIQNMLELLAPPAGFTIEVMPRLPLLVTQRVPLETVLRNLLSNAIKHHHQPSSGWIKITAQEQAESIDFCICDNGPGIAPEFQERIFGMFQTLKPRDQVEGSGIGLALVKKTLENYGGQITLESDLGQGTTFRFRWPKA